jgi:copper chaperone CopZ
MMTTFPSEPGPARTAPRAGAERELSYVVAGMTCDHCRLSITEEVADVAGVAAVDVDLDTKRVRVRGIEVDDDAVVAAIDEAGYEAVAA